MEFRLLPPDGGYRVPQHQSSEVPSLFRVVVPVNNIETAAEFYGRVLGFPGERISPNRHYFHCGGAILVCLDPRAGRDAVPNPEPIYFAVSNIEEIYKRARQAGCQSMDESIEVQHWGERAFFAKDPFGNPICFVDQTTLFTGSQPIE
jgi:predicted enzyme related to lactoylglutathione lyase